MKSPLFDSSSCEQKISSCQNENNFYKLFWPKEVLQHIWLASNEGKSFNFADLEKYFIIIIIMGIVPLPSLKDYWAQNKTNHGLFGVKAVKQLMSRDKFKYIHSSICFDTKWIEDYLNNLFKTLWNLYQNLVVDETSIAFKRIWRRKQNILEKPNSTGIKFFALCDSTGFLYSFWIYRGKEETTHDARESGILLEFIEQLPKLNYIITMDSYYGSLDFDLKLQGNNTHYLKAL